MRPPALLRALGPLLPGLRVEALGALPAAVRGVKTTTGIVGVPVVPNARDELRQQLQAVLDALAAIPETAEYRRAVEKTVHFKLQAVNGDQPDEAIEELFSQQLEEEIKMCKEELQLIPKMAEWKPWDVPADYKVPIMEERHSDGAPQAAQHVPTPK